MVVLAQLAGVLVDGALHSDIRVDRLPVVLDADETLLVRCLVVRLSARILSFFFTLSSRLRRDNLDELFKL